MHKGEQGMQSPNTASPAPLFPEGNHFQPDGFFASFFREAICSAYGWGPVQIFQAYTVLIQQDTPSDAVYYLDKGSVKLTWVDQAGHEVIAGLRHHLWIIGAPAVLLEKPYSFTATTLTQSSMRCIAAGKFLHLVKTHPDFALHLIRMLSLEVFNQGKKLVIMGCIPAKDRLKNLFGRVIHNMHVPGKSQKQIKIDLPLKHKELAQVVGVTPEHLCRLLKEMEREKLIKRTKDGLLFPNPEKLHEWAHL